MSTDKDILKVLVSDTRRDIIKQLSNGSRTPSDLSRMLNKSKSTIVEHLDKLADAGLVEKIERPGGKWVFYSLTKDGESLVPKRSNSILVVLSIVFLSLISGSFSLYAYIMQPFFGQYATQRLPGIETVNDVLITAKNPMFLYISALLFSVSIVGMFSLIIMKRKRFVGM